MHFYSEEWLSTPEFRYENRIDELKPKDLVMLEEYLKKKEDDAAKKAEEEAAQAAANTGGAPAKGKADPKKDAKGKPPAKGAAPVEDKNSPQAITVEYPEIDNGCNYMIFERDYMVLKPKTDKKSQAPGADK